MGHPDEFKGGDRLTVSYDLGRYPAKEMKAAIKAWCDWLPRHQEIRWLNLWTHVTPPVFEAACRIEGLECLQVKWSNLTSLDAIEGLASLRYLSIGSSTRIASIAPLASLKQLRVLSIENFKLIDDFSPLAELTSLESLSVTGSMWTRQDVGDLAPFARMTWLKDLAIDTSKVKSVQPLAALTQLEHLEIGGRLPMEEYARLSARLPRTKGQWFQPYLDMQGSGIGPCKRCRLDALVYVTGKGGPTLCRYCDKERLDRYVAAFREASK